MKIYGRMDCGTDLNAVVIGVSKDSVKSHKNFETKYNLASIHADRRIRDLQSCQFRVACDVKNPLCGPDGATYTYGPQKGVTTEWLETIDLGMANYARVTNKFLCERTATPVMMPGSDKCPAAGACSDLFELSRDIAKMPGAGAAGGLGFAFLAFLNAELLPGAELILEATRLEDDIRNADVVVTGEGRLDAQTSMGKAPIVVAKLAKKYGAKVLIFAGSIAPDAAALKNGNFDACFPILREISTLKEAMKPENACANLTATAEQVFRLL